ncbi:hypothetical protein HHI36_006244 [Cryptolaemus montrouzieri]|uniref:Uncharacterized protein n=1 Tax=Cryptolaemus montrouzieri TaxID=559131 RepID=A0ABD2NWI0_9CUCU
MTMDGNRILSRINILKLAVLSEDMISKKTTSSFSAVWVVMFFKMRFEPDKIPQAPEATYQRSYKKDRKQSKLMPSVIIDNKRKEKKNNSASVFNVTEVVNPTAGAATNIEAAGSEITSGETADGWSLALERRRQNKAKVEMMTAVAVVPPYRLPKSTKITSLIQTPLPEALQLLQIRSTIKIKTNGQFNGNSKKGPVKACKKKAFFVSRVEVNTNLNDLKNMVKINFPECDCVGLD